jgi:hypothetical protein
MIIEKPAFFNPKIMYYFLAKNAVFWYIYPAPAKVVTRRSPVVVNDYKKGFLCL